MPGHSNEDLNLSNGTSTQKKPWQNRGRRTSKGSQKGNNHHNKGRSSSKGTKDPNGCYHCGKPRHFKRKCYFYKRSNGKSNTDHQEESNKLNKTKNDYQNANLSDDYDSVDVYVAASSFKDDWIIDSGWSPVAWCHNTKEHVIEDTKAILWHRRLGHISESGLQLMREQKLLGKDKRHRTVRKIPQQNGVAERMNMTILNKASCMLFNVGLSNGFWGETVVTTAYLINISPSSAIEGKIPEKRWTGKPPDLCNLKVFGCAAYAHQSIGKFEPRTLKCIFLGYPEGVKVYRRERRF
uniref:CCHC-type domain-containing protein n=1 Tax=Cannabis sativa TaxID=3483 RepID=A0A803PE38_CANSA